MTPRERPPAAPGRPSPLAVRLIRGLLTPLADLAHRPTLEGTEHLPTRGPFLLVANHSAGMGLAEISCFVTRYLDQVGPERPLAGFAHPIGFAVWPLTWVHRQLGSIPSTYEAAFEALEADAPILIFPGGDHETLRPLWQADRVDFGGHRGFLRIARRAGVPIVPMGIQGSHATAPIVVGRSRALAWLLVLPRLAGIKRWAISLLGLVGAGLLAGAPLPWPLRLLLIMAWLACPLTFLPILPLTVRMRIGPPLEPEALFDLDREEDEDVAAALPRVERTVQALVDDSRA